MQACIYRLQYNFIIYLYMLYIYIIYIYIFEVFVCLFAVIINATATARIDSKRSGIMKNDPKSVLQGLKSPVFVLSGRYHDISVFVRSRPSCLIFLALLALAYS